MSNIITWMTSAQLRERLVTAEQAEAEAAKASKKTPWSTEATERLTAAEIEVLEVRGSLDFMVKREAEVAERNAAEAKAALTRTLEQHRGAVDGWSHRIEQNRFTDLKSALAVVAQRLAEIDRDGVALAQHHAKAREAATALGLTEAEARLPPEPNPDAVRAEVRRFLRERLGPAPFAGWLEAPAGAGPKP